jgi:hypothetical protein
VCVGGGGCAGSSAYADLWVLVDVDLDLRTRLSDNPKGFEGRGKWSRERVPCWRENENGREQMPCWLGDRTGEMGQGRWGFLATVQGSTKEYLYKTSSYRCHPALDKHLLRLVRGRSRPLEVSDRTSRDARRANVRVTSLEESRRDVVAARERVAYRGRAGCSCG